MKKILCVYDKIGYDGSENTCIGNKNQRICRFCGKTRPEVTFKKRAHAISESLGNTNIIGYEECDTCNENFSIIEQDFYNRHSVLLSCLDIKGKNGSRKIKTSDVSLFTKKGIWNIAPNKPYEDFIQYNENGIGNFDFSFILNSNPHKPQNIYKCLVKYILSIVDSSYLISFQDTIKWIMKEELSDIQLPHVILYPTQILKHPRIASFVRMSNNYKFPYALGIVEFANIGYFFIIPNANGEPINRCMIDNFHITFKTLFGNRKYVDVDLSSIKVIKDKYHLKIDNIILNRTAYIHPLKQIFNP